MSLVVRKSRMHAVIRAIGLLVALAGAQAAQQSRMTSAWRAAVVEGVSAQLLEAYFDRAVAEKIAARVRARLKAGSDIREAPFDAAEAKKIAGRYQYPASVLRLWIEADRLIAQVEGRARRYSFTRRADGSYFAAVDRVVIRFLRNDTGDIIGLDWTEGGRSSPARRIP